MSRTSGFLPLRRVCSRCPNTARLSSPTCRKGWAIGAPQAAASAVCVDHSWTLSLSTEKPAAPPKPSRSTMRAFTPSLEDLNLLIQEVPQSPEDPQKHNADRLIFSPPLLSQDAVAAAARGDAAQAACDRTKRAPQERNPRPTSSRHRVSSTGLDSRQSATPSSQPNPTVRSSHHIVPQTESKCQQRPSSTNGNMKSK